MNKYKFLIYVLKFQAIYSPHTDVLIIRRSYNQSKFWQLFV